MEFLEATVIHIRGRIIFQVEDEDRNLHFFKTAISANAEFPGAFNVDDEDEDED